MSILVTGVAGFLGMHVTEALLRRSETVVGVDDLNGLYATNLKEARLRRLAERPGLRVIRGDIGDSATWAAVKSEDDDAVTAVLHLAGQARSRWSLTPAPDWVGRRLERHLAVLDFCRDRPPGARHLVYAVPENEPEIHGLEIVLGRVLARSQGIAQTALRLPSIYGPWGRPDELCYRLTDAIAAGRPVMLPEPDAERHALLYVDDAVAAVLMALDSPPATELGAAHRLWHLAAAEMANSGRVVGAIEQALGRTARRMAVAGDTGVPESDIDGAGVDPAWRPAVTLEEGVARFVAWHRGWHAGAGPNRHKAGP